MRRDASERLAAHVAEGGTSVGRGVPAMKASLHHLLTAVQLPGKTKKSSLVIKARKKELLCFHLESRMFEAMGKNWSIQV